jgi:hypothetical protein
MIRAIVHGIEGSLELYGFGCERLSDNFERDECNIVYVVVLVDRSCCRQWC